MNPPLLLATSCLQGRPLADTFVRLAGLGADGFQLTPGNLPTPGLQRMSFAFPLRFHHGFSWTERRAEVCEGEVPILGGPDWSIHPPPAVKDPARWLEAAAARALPLEVMPEGFLGCDADIALAMDIGCSLAVDIAHLQILCARGVLSEGVLRRLFEYPEVVEVHVSASDGRCDVHAPIGPDTPFLGWAKRRGVPLVLECYMHLLSAEERRRQVEVLRA